MNRVQRMEAKLFGIFHPDVKVSMDGLGSIILRSSNKKVLENISVNLDIPELVVTETQYGNYQLWLHTKDVDELLGE